MCGVSRVCVFVSLPISTLFLSRIEHLETQTSKIESSGRELPMFESFHSKF